MTRKYLKLSDELYELKQFRPAQKDDVAKWENACAKLDHAANVQDKVQRGVSDELWGVLSRVIDTRPSTAFGLAIKSSILPIWIRDGLGLAEDIGQDLAIAIANDAMMLGGFTTSVRHLLSAEPKPSAEVVQH